MSPRRRKPENRGFPTGWRWKGKRLYYMVPKGQESAWDGKVEFPLGSSAAEAYKTWAERIGQDSRGSLNTVDELCDHYAREHIPTLAKTTQESYRISIVRIRAVFSGVPVSAVSQQDARALYNKIRADKGPASARMTAGTLKHVMTMAAEWGAISTNPLLGMRFQGAKASQRFLTRSEISSILSISPANRTQHVGLAFVKLALLTGLRRGDLLSLKVSDCTDDGIVVTPNKTSGSSGVHGLFEWTPELREAVDYALGIKPSRIGDAPLIVTNQGKSYLDENMKANGFDSVSRRFIDATIKQGLVSQRWTMKDLRGSCSVTCRQYGRSSEATYAQLTGGHREALSTCSGEAAASFTCTVYDRLNRKNGIESEIITFCVGLQANKNGAPGRIRTSDHLVRSQVSKIRHAFDLLRILRNPISDSKP